MATRNNSKKLPRSGGAETVFISGATWDTLVDTLEALEGVFSPEDFDVRQGKDGKQVKMKPGKGGGTVVQTGAFCRVFQDNGNWMLSGGVVSSGDGNNEVIDDIGIGNVGSEPADGRIIWLNVSFMANISEGWLLPSGEVTSATDNNGSVLPGNIAPTKTTPSGRCIVPLGIWNNEKFTPYGCGNVLVAHCFGALTYSRI